MVANEVIKKSKKIKLNNYDLNAKNGLLVTNSSDEESFLNASKDDLLADENSICEEKIPYKLELVWKNIIAFALMHAYVIYGLNHFLRLDSYKVIYIRKCAFCFFVVVDFLSDFKFN